MEAIDPSPGIVSAIAMNMDTLMTEKMEISASMSPAAKMTSSYAQAGLFSVKYDEPLFNSDNASEASNADSEAAARTLDYLVPKVEIEDDMDSANEEPAYYLEPKIEYEEQSADDTAEDLPADYGPGSKGVGAATRRVVPKSEPLEGADESMPDDAQEIEIVVDPLEMLASAEADNGLYRVPGAEFLANMFAGPARKDKPFTCHLCDGTFTTRGNLNSHLRLHSGVRPYVCPECGQGFSVRHNLTAHIRTHTGEKPFSCEYCERSFNDKSSLTRHTRTHTGEKPFTCPDCGMSFAIHSNMKIHRRKHTGYRPYACPQCMHCFRDKSSLVRHIKTHQGIKSHSCDKCSQRFTSRSNLKRHLQVHTGEKPFPCIVCSKAFPDRNKLNRHSVMRHYVRIDPVVQNKFRCLACNEGFKSKYYMKKHSCDHKEGGK